MFHAGPFPSLSQVRVCFPNDDLLLSDYDQKTNTRRYARYVCLAYKK